MASSSPCSQRGQSGFSLIELAVVLMIVGILMSGVLMSVSQASLSARRSAALSQLRGIEEALYGFAQSQGRLPCPASQTSNGYEDGAAGACNLTEGFVPSATLAIFGQATEDGLLVDPWANPIRYSLVTTATLSNNGNPDFSQYTSIRTFFSNSYTFGTTNTLRVCDNSTCSGNVLTDIAPAIVMSMGENWATYSSANETLNAGSGTLTGSTLTYPVHLSTEKDYVSTTYSEDNFDDQIVWLSPYVMFNRMVSAGKLP